MIINACDWQAHNPTGGQAVDLQWRYAQLPRIGKAVGNTRADDLGSSWVSKTTKKSADISKFIQKKKKLNKKEQSDVEDLRSFTPLFFSQG